MMFNRQRDGFKLDHQNLDGTIIYFLVIKSIIFFKKRKKSMRQNELLCKLYANWLKDQQFRAEKNILRSFMNIAENFYNPNSKMDNKSIYLSTHAGFLIQVLTTQDSQASQLFPTGIIILNFILKEKPQFRIQLTQRLIMALRSYFRAGETQGYSGQLAGSSLWLVCRCLQGTSDKREALVRLGESELIEDFLREGQLDPQAQKAVGMLLYFISKNLDNRTKICEVILKNAEKINHPQAIKHVLATLRQATPASFAGNIELEVALSNFLVRFMRMNEVSLSDKMQYLSLIAFAAVRNPNLLVSLRVTEIIQNKLNPSMLPYEPMMTELAQLIELLACNKESIANLLSLAAGTLTDNVVSRRVFILFHEHMTKPQLIAIMGVLPCALHRLLANAEQRENGLKLLICMKRVVNRLGLSRVFWYFCKALLQEALVYKSDPLTQSSQELYELFEEIMQDEIQFLYNI